MATNEEKYLAFKTSGYINHMLYLLDRKNKTLEAVLSIHDYREEFLKQNKKNLFYKACYLSNEELKKYANDFITESELLALEELYNPMLVRCSEGVNVLVTNETRIVPCHELPKLNKSKFQIKEVDGNYTLEEIHSYLDYSDDLVNGNSSYGTNVYYLESCLDLVDQIVFRESVISLGDAIALRTIEESFSKKITL